MKISRLSVAIKQKLNYSSNSNSSETSMSKPSANFFKVLRVGLLDGLRASKSWRASRLTPDFCASFS